MGLSGRVGMSKLIHDDGGCDRANGIRSMGNERTKLSWLLETAWAGLVTALAGGFSQDLERTEPDAPCDARSQRCLSACGSLRIPGTEEHDQPDE